MYIDMFGKKRVKLGLHQHTTRSDGRLSPEAVAALYRDAGYDAIALTDHWVYGEADVISGLPILPGAEYNIGMRDTGKGIYHVLCLFADRAPSLSYEDFKSVTVQEIIDRIHEAGGLAVLAHPAWSLNTFESVKNMQGIDAIEIYNTVSRNILRDDASLLIDLYAAHGARFPLVATDDFHHGEPVGGIEPTAFIMVECDSVAPPALKKAILEGRYYASTGPEIHFKREGNAFVVDCSPASTIAFYTNCVVSAGRVVRGQGLTHAVYKCIADDTYVRACVTDSEGRMAWSQIISV